jgi:hypothetical protein
MEQGAGWRYFAATILGVAGVMRIFDAIWAWTYSGPLPEHLQDALLGHTLDTYGWLDMIVALILIGSSFGVVAGSSLSRWVGIVAGALLAISSVWWMPYYPVWSFTYIGVAMLVIYALAVHGGRESTEAFVA